MKEPPVLSGGLDARASPVGHAPDQADEAVFDQPVGKPSYGDCHRNDKDEGGRLSRDGWGVQLDRRAHNHTQDGLVGKIDRVGGIPERHEAGRTNRRPFCSMLTSPASNPPKPSP